MRATRRKKGSVNTDLTVPPGPAARYLATPSPGAPDTGSMSITLHRERSAVPRTGPKARGKESTVWVSLKLHREPWQCRAQDPRQDTREHYSMGKLEEGDQGLSKHTLINSIQGLSN
jgi:hypothetical protein